MGLPLYNPHVFNAISVSALSPTVELATFFAGEKVTGQRQLGISELGSVELVLERYDETFNNLIGGSVVDETTAANVNITSPNFLNANRPQLTLGIVIGFQTLSTGQNQTGTLIYPNCQVSPTALSANQGGGQNPNPLSYTVSPTITDRISHGELFSATNLAVTDNKDAMVIYASETESGFAPFTYIDDGVATTATAGFLPTSSDATGATNLFTDEGVEDSANVSAVDTATGQVTFTASVAGNRRIFFLQTQFQPSS